MDRRQFLQTLNASGMGAILPAASVMPPLFAQTAVVEKVGTAWNIPKIGIVSVGTVGGTCLPTAGDRNRSLPYLNRTIAVDTYGIELHFMNADHKVLLGAGKTLLNPHTARLLAQSAGNLFADAFSDLDLVLLVAGMGGATGTGIAPVVAQVLREQGIHTLAFAVMPFECEGVQRQQIAQTGILELRSQVDALIPFFNIGPDAKKIRWQSVAAQQAQVAFMEVCQSIMNPVCRPGWVNIDFETLQHIMSNQEGECAFGFGSANDARDAATAAINSPLLGQGQLLRASAALIAIEAPQQFLQLQDSWTVLNSVREQMSSNADVLFATTYDEDLDQNITVSILANGIRG